MKIEALGKASKEVCAPRKTIKAFGKMAQDYLKECLSNEQSVLALSGLYNTVMEEVEKPLLLMVLKHSKGNQTKAAQILGINRNTLRKKMIQFKIVSP